MAQNYSHRSFSHAHGFSLTLFNHISCRSPALGKSKLCLKQRENWKERSEKLGAVFEIGKRMMGKVALWSYWSVMENFR